MLLNNIDDFLNQAAEDVNRAYGATEQQLASFKQFLLSETQVTILRGGSYVWESNGAKKIGYTSAVVEDFSIPTRNIAYATMAAGISLNGDIPDHKSFLTTYIDCNEATKEEVKNKVTRKSYYESLISGIHSWIFSNAENQKLDPNVSEIIEIIVAVNNIKALGDTVSNETQTKLDEIWNNRSNNFTNNQLGTDNLAYKISSNCYNGEFSGKYIDLATQKALQKIAAIDLYFCQELRAKGKYPRYNNAEELSEINGYFRALSDIPNNISKYVQEFVKNVSLAKNFEVEGMVSNIYNWLLSSEENKNSDPNAYELVEIFTRVNNIRNMGKNVAPWTEQQIREIWENRKNNFIKNGLGADNLAFRICEDSYNNYVTKSSISESSMQALQKMASLDLYVKQAAKRGSQAFLFTKDNKEYKEVVQNLSIANEEGLNFENYFADFEKSLGIENSKSREL